MDLQHIHKIEAFSLFSLKKYIYILYSRDSMSSMAKHIFDSLMIMLLVCTMSQAATSLKSPHKHGSITGKYIWLGRQHYELPAEPRGGYYAYLHNKCLNVLKDKCGEEMFDYIFYKRNGLSGECCQELIKMGQQCNNDLSWTLSKIKGFGKWEGHIYHRSTGAFKMCHPQKQKI